MDVHFSSKTDLWATPQDTFDALAAEFGPFDLDVCATPENAKCARYYTCEDDGLAQPWDGACWMNPHKCTCVVHPNVLYLDHENKKMPKLLEDIAAHGRELVVENGEGKGISFFLVQGMQSRTCTEKTGKEEKQPRKEEKATQRENEICTKRKGKRSEKTTEYDLQQCETSKTFRNRLCLGQGTLGLLQEIMENEVRILWRENNIDARSLYSIISSPLSRHSAVEHGASLLAVQFEKGSDTPKRVLGVSGICPNCGKAGFLSVNPPRLFMNPPYGREIKKWMRKAYEASQNGATVVCLVPARTDTAWWHDYAMKGQIRFLRGRLKFGGAANSAPFPSAVVVFSNQEVNGE